MITGSAGFNPVIALPIYQQCAPFPSQHLTPLGQLPLPSPAPSQGLLSRLSIRRTRPRKNTRPRALPGIFGIGTASRAPFYGSLTLWCFYGFFRVWLGFCCKEL